MVHQTRTQSEAQLENEMIEQLVGQGFERVSIPSVQALQDNFRTQINKLNEENLEGHALSDKEFERLLLKIEGKSVFESAKILRDKEIISRDDDSILYLKLFDTQNHQNNFLQVTHQTTVVGRYTNRYDVTLLFNGLPLVQIELKRRGLHFAEGFNQIMRYRKDSYGGLFNFLQVFVVSNGVDTKYFANSDREPMKSLMFFWSDDANKRITKLDAFTASFLNPVMLQNVLSKYMIINETDKHLMVMRPYQIYAVERILHQTIEKEENGYVWHTTGSGKTLTSFKASELLAQQEDIKKVIFLVDRKDLDSQTMEEFNKFEKDSVDRTTKTGVLVKQLKDPNRKRIITTIQKMAHAVKTERYRDVMKLYENEKVVFVIDECHRSQFGEMNLLIKRHFKRAQYIGFTGTPRFVDNKSQDGRTTSDLFQDCLHTYLIKDAIHDGNVLGFSVEYIRTMKGKDGIDDVTKVPGIDQQELWLADTRIDMIARHITSIHSNKTHNKKYTGLLTAESIPAAIKYYDAFKKIDSGIKIASIFSFGTNEESVEGEEHSRHSLERIMEDFNQEFGSNHTTENFAAYFADVSKKVKSAQIDLLIVVDMFLTGFDAKTLSTLYVDRPLKHHSLIQAYSRTNRVEGPKKQYGNIVCYRNLKDETDTAVRLFSQTGDTETVLMKRYDQYLADFKDQLDQLLDIAVSPEAVDDLEGESKQKEFVISFRDLTRILTKLKTFVEYDFNQPDMGISEQTYKDFRSKYLLLYENDKNAKDKVSVINDIDFEIELMQTDKINVDYILELLRNTNFENKNERDAAVRRAIKEVNEASSDEMRLKRDLLLEFLQGVAPTLTNKDSINQKYHDFENKRRKREIQAMSEQVQVAEDRLEYFMKEYEYTGVSPDQEINDAIKAPFKEKRKRVQALKDFIYDNVRKYS
ncbi:type I site-specific deoxyribonuclease HsdR family subfamily protein [Planococcus donghaensis MPA1U2]|uniref:Type I restriction enzyme endonuclease subunit n=1 Tax=Planococcus donghaensis MPA1U2 TaxID=933115 RepID=E7RKL1_9BACL|nr:type I restriction endonuclease subunit R [Planococcus donghaensis]EGA88441.1 type I site-specific deoxyribonuclease HsdR family subfamily protein [Planococcus donghaensis MPA1U2]